VCKLVTAIEGKKEIDFLFLFECMPKLDGAAGEDCLRLHTSPGCCRG
jgi:hypothetical protein